MPLEWLGRGDRVLTRDAGYKPVLRIEHTRLSMATLKHLPELAPVKIEAGALDHELPSRDLHLSPSQLVYVDRDPAQPGAGGVLVPADAVAPRLDPTSRPKAELINYVSVLLDGHHLIQIEGAWVGSFFIADIGHDLHPDDPMLVGVSNGYMTPAAPILRRKDADAFLSRRRSHVERRLA